MLVRILAIFALWLCCSFGHAEEAVEIPLDQIWALNMPSTKDVRELESRQDRDLRKTTTSRIRSKLMRRYEEGVKAGPCFLVIGEGKEALLNAAKVIVDGAPTTEKQPTDKKLSLVFYSYPAPGYVHIDSVVRSSSTISVKFKVVIHRSAEATSHFALIPLGELQAGKYNLEILEVPSETPYEKHDITERSACDSCTFTIQNERARP